MFRIIKKSLTTGVVTGQYPMAKASQEPVSREAIEKANQASITAPLNGAVLSVSARRLPSGENRACISHAMVEVSGFASPPSMGRR